MEYNDKVVEKGVLFKILTWSNSHKKLTLN
jgi:hypothetical protein